MKRLALPLVAAMVLLTAPRVLAAEQPSARLEAEAPAAPEAVTLTGNGTQPPLAEEMENSSNCQGCHGDYDQENDIEQWVNWAGSMMAQATRDPLFWAALDVANNDALEDPDIPDDVGEFCLRCHTPVGWLEGRARPQPDGCGLDGWIDDIDGDFDGVTCHTCHRMMINDDPPQGQESFYLENGQYWIDDTDCGGTGGPCRRGPYDYPADGQFEPPGSHPWAWSPYHESSDICGNCHNVTNPAKPLRDASGVPTGLDFPVERTYTEWTQSDYAPLRPMFNTCQNCHMPDPDPAIDPAYACLQSQNNHAGDLPIHQMVGGNAWIPDVLKGEYPGLGLSAEFDRTRALALDMLQNRSALVEITVDPEVAEGGSLDARVQITNTAGHKLPTGYSEGRRMWINLQARDGEGTLIFESGAYDGATGVLTQDAQAKVYEVQHGIWNRNGTAECDVVDNLGRKIFHFVLSDCIRLDNRIPPLGFTGMNDPETQPVGYSYPETFPGSGILVNYDTTDYSIPVPPGTPGPVTVTASLHYQTASKEYIDFLLNEALENAFPNDCTPRLGGPINMSRGEYMHQLWESYDRSPPVEMGTAAGQSAVVPQNLDLANTIIDTTETFLACDTITLGPGLVIQAPADVKIKAGVGVEMVSRVEVATGARLDVEIDPSLCG